MPKAITGGLGSERIFERNHRIARLRFLFIIIAFAFLNGCSFPRPILQEEIGGLGRFKFREPAYGLEGVVIAAPHGGTERHSDKLALAISDRTGAGLVMVYGFKSKRLSVTQPQSHCCLYIQPVKERKRF